MSFENDSQDSFSEAINRAFSKQSYVYDQSDRSNIVLQDMRHQVYAHVENYLVPESHILELNAGTGLDALHFISAGHQVHATDLSDGMISQVRSKISKHDHSNRLTCQQLSLNQLDKIHLKNFANQYRQKSTGQSPETMYNFESPMPLNFPKRKEELYTF